MLCHAGVMFMSANRENVRAMDTIGIDIGTFSMGYMSITFLLFLYAYFMIQLFAELGKRSNKSASLDAPSSSAEYRTLPQMAQTGDEDAADDGTHVLFDVADMEERGVGAAWTGDLCGRAAAPASSSRSSDEIELSPIGSS
ncbi:hypothetical protein IWQ56_001361 [Coemansia nantahalensis]|nr:hypothetical protein IWQ56_001361 [Coemansia nantahalensis]